MALQGYSLRYTARQRERGSIDRDSRIPFSRALPRASGPPYDGGTLASWNRGFDCGGGGSRRGAGETGGRQRLRMMLVEWHERLDRHFQSLRQRRSASAGHQAIFALEHDLQADELRALSTDI